MLYGYFYWWYGAGLQQSWQVALAIVAMTADFFSLDSLVRTWLAPWKNDVSSAQNAALSDQVKLWQQNLASRIIGFLIRTIIILAALITLGVLAVLAGASLIVWLVVPLLIFVLPLLAVWMVSR